MNIILTKTELKLIWSAILIAIDSEEDFIDAHRTGLRLVNGCSEQFILPEHRSIVEKTERRIKKWKALLKKLTDL